MSGMTIDTLTDSIVLGLNAQGIVGVAPYLEQLARGIATGIYTELTKYGGTQVCPAMDLTP